MFSLYFLSPVSTTPTGHNTSFSRYHGLPDPLPSPYQAIPFPPAAVKPSPTKGQSSGEINLTPIISVVAGVVGGLLVVLIVVCVVVRVRLGRRARPQCGREEVREQSSGHEESTSEPLHPKTPPPAALHAKAPPPTTLHDALPPPPVLFRDGDERNPDVIQHGGARDQPWRCSAGLKTPWNITSTTPL